MSSRKEIKNKRKIERNVTEVRFKTNPQFRENAKKSKTKLRK